MNFFCDVLANVPAMAGAPVIAGIQLMFPDLPETEAREHWILGGSADSLAGRKGVSALTPAGVQPTFFANYLETALGARNGLLSGFPDSDKQAFAMVMHFTGADVGGGRVLIGSTTASSGSGARTDGFLLSQAQSNAENPHQIQFQYRPGFNTTPFPLASLTDLAGKWIFIGVATDFETRVRSFYIHGLGHVSPAADTAAWAKAQVPVAFGNGYYAPSSGQSSQYDRGIAIAEAMAFDKVPTAQMWADIAQRAVMRCALRGLTVHTGQ